MLDNPYPEPVKNVTECADCEKWWKAEIERLRAEVRRLKGTDVESHFTKLSEVMGKKLIDADGYVIEEGGLCFSIVNFYFDDGTKAHAEGWHDTASLSGFPDNNEDVLCEEHMEKFQSCACCGERLVLVDDEWVCSDGECDD